jgi:hypothetical protein
LIEVLFESLLQRKMLKSDYMAMAIFVTESWDENIVMTSHVEGSPRPFVGNIYGRTVIGRNDPNARSATSRF